MPEHRHPRPEFQDPASSPPPIGPLPHPLPDLFGFVPPASPTVTSTPTGRAAEWPAAGAPRTVPIYGAPDRPLASAPPRPPSSLAGDYARRDTARVSTLTRADGVTLTVEESYRPKKGPTDSGRFVRVGYPGGGRPTYASNLYDRRKPGPGPLDDLDGHAVQHGPRGRWYLIRCTGPDAYRLDPVPPSRRRGRAGR